MYNSSISRRLAGRINDIHQYLARAELIALIERTCSMEDTRAGTSVGARLINFYDRKLARTGSFRLCRQTCWVEINVTVGERLFGQRGFDLHG